MEHYHLDGLKSEEVEMQKSATRSILIILSAIIAFSTCVRAMAGVLDKSVIEKAAGTRATIQGEVVRIGWVRNDVKVEIDGVAFPPAAGLGSWATFKPTGRKGDDAIVMGDTVVFRDEVDAAMDAAFSHGLSVTALHNHFFYDRPKVYFMHIGGHGTGVELAGAVKAVWDAIKKVRSAKPEPADSFSGGPAIAGDGTINAGQIREITGLESTRKPGGVVKISSGRKASMSGTGIAGSMGLTSWAAFTGDDTAAVMDGDFIMSIAEVQPVLKAMRKANLHIVALHNHMLGEQPPYFFAHFWGRGTVADLARGFRTALNVEKDIQRGK